ncbi:DUF3311 domain-containing protein [Micromonospora sp. KC723]|uniref:DUF3311 domain-containing protein n=1 Tax=Micromonospora sp. KC723 TaxID=2530381 RepID=UPI001044581B|nr:DUF3311 domain-containing protein [Micromonospora sp. KC723]TDB77037.1 DUF3311 domain-containing protein [Micromonospora sp. KC723]
MSDPVTPPARSGSDATTTDPTTSSRAKDHSPWNWLLFVPIVVPLIPALFNADSPRFLGFPRFYWLQLAYILLGVATTTLVYQMTKNRGDR